MSPTEHGRGGKGEQLKLVRPSAQPGWASALAFLNAFIRQRTTARRARRAGAAIDDATARADGRERPILGLEWKIGPGSGRECDVEERRETGIGGTGHATGTMCGRKTRVLSVLWRLRQPVRAYAYAAARTPRDPWGLPGGLTTRHTSRTAENLYFLRGFLS